MKKFLSLLLVALMALNLVACSKPSSDSASSAENGSKTENVKQEEKVVVVANTKEPLHFNLNAVDTGSAYPAANIFSALFQKTLPGDIVPDLSEKYEISDDGLTYTFHLAKNVKWHDGVKFTSDDVKFTVGIIVKEKGRNSKVLSNIEEVTCPDENTIVFKLKEKNAALISSLPQVYILPKHLYEGQDWLSNPANQNPVGTGPFKFKEFNKGSDIVIVANDEYFKGRPHLDKIIYKTIPDINTIVQAYLNDEVDVIDLAAAISPGSMPVLESAPNTKIRNMISADRQYMIANLQKEPWNNVKVRQALSYAVNREEMLKKAQKGYGAVSEGFYTPVIPWAFAEEYTMPERDVEKAKKLLDEAGYTPDANGIRIKDVDIVLFSFATFVDMAKVIEANLREVGIECKITTLEWSAWDEKLKQGEFDLSILGGIIGPDPDAMSSRIASDGSLNYMKYNNPELDKTLQEGRTETKPEKRAEIYKNMQKIMSEDLPILPLIEWCYIVVTKDNIVNHYADLPKEAGNSSYFYMDIK